MALDELVLESPDLGSLTPDEQRWLYENFSLLQSQMNKDFFFEVANGKVSGHSAVRVIAHSAVIDNTIKTVWEENILYTYSVTADITQISSSNAGDTHVIDVVGLDANWNPTTDTIQLQGQTPVTLTNPLIRINELINNTAIATLGEIYVWVPGGGATAGVPNTQADIRARITFVSGIANEKSVSSVCSIPAATRGAVVFGKTSVTANKALELTFWVRPFGSVFKMAHHIDVKDNNYDYFFKLPGFAPAKSDMEVRATVDTGTAEVSANYDIILIEDGF